MLQEANKSSRTLLPMASIDELRMNAQILSPKEEAKEKDRAEILLNKFVEMFGEYIPTHTLNRVLRKQPEKRIIVTNSDNFREIYHTWDDPEDNEQDNGSIFSEIGVRYYVFSVIEKLDLYRFLNDDAEKSINYYKSIVDKYGADVHKLFFGKPINIDTKKEILDAFGQEELNQILPKGYDAHFSSGDFTSSKHFKYVSGLSLDPDFLIVINDQRNKFDELHKNAKKRLINSCGSENQARFVTKEASMNDTTLHEMIHLFEPDDTGE